MTLKHSTAIDALDEFFRVIRNAADSNAAMATELVQALSIPVEIVHEPKALARNLPYLDPVVWAGQGLDEFRRIFRPMTDAQMRKIITHFNIAPKEQVPTRGGPKGEDLFELLWTGALNQRRRLDR